MENLESVDPGLLHRVQDLLRRKPNSYDVLFSVGPAKKAVRAVRILLEAASPTLEKKFKLWEDSVAREESGGGIPLPDFDPEDFEIFVKFTMLDEWNAQALTNLNLQAGQILNLISICRVYEIQTGVKHLEDLMNSFYDNFASFVKTPDFLRLSYAHLETILASDNLPLKEPDVFDCACRWAKEVCARRGIEGTAENLQLVLGDAIYQIRFPLMTSAEFTQCIDAHNILSESQGFQIYRFVNSNDIQRAGLVQSTVKREVKANPLKIVPKAVNVQTQVMKATTPQTSTLDLTIHSKIVDNPPFICDGTENTNMITTYDNILVHGLGFLGPIDRDASYEVTVTIPRSNLTEPITKRISAQKGNVFRIMFDQPITLKGGSWNLYFIVYTLKGPNTKSFQRKMNTRVTEVDGENVFTLVCRSNQLAEILYTYV